MITVTQKKATYSFFLVQNAKNIKMNLQRFNGPQGVWSHTDPWSKLKRNDIVIPEAVIKEAKEKAMNMIVVA